MDSVVVISYSKKGLARSANTDLVKVVEHRITDFAGPTRDSQTREYQGPRYHTKL